MDLDWNVIINNALTIGVAYLLALPTAWNRESKARSAGLRTFPLVSTASCGFTLIAASVLPEADSHARIIQGIITGIGFIGGGAILKSNERVSGTATAASIWATGAIGVSVALHRLEIAILIALFTYITFQLVPKAKTLVDSSQAGTED